MMYIYGVWNLEAIASTSTLVCSILEEEERRTEGGYGRRKDSRKLTLYILFIHLKKLHNATEGMY